MEDLTEVITASEFHPHHCNLFVYSSSKGSLRLCDMRASALCDKHSKRKSTEPQMSLKSSIHRQHVDGCMPQCIGFSLAGTLEKETAKRSNFFHLCKY